MKIIDISDTIFCRYLLCGPEAVATAHAAEAVAAVPAEEADSMEIDFDPSTCPVVVLINY